MDKKKRRALEAAGWTIGTVQDLLELTDEEMAFVEVKVALSKALKDKRRKKRLTQTQVARLVGSSQPRVAKMERGESSLDSLVRSLLAIGASPREIGRKIAAATA